MYLLKRRKDSKFWRNRGYHSFYRHDPKSIEKEWVSDPSLCVPFSSLEGAIKSRGASIPSPFSDPEDWNAEGARALFWKQNAEWHSLRNRPKRMEVFHSLYEIVPVKISEV